MQTYEEKLILRPKDVRRLTGLGRVQVYALWKRPDFPGKRHGKTLFVSREAFLKWLQEGGEK